MKSIINSILFLSITLTFSCQQHLGQFDELPKDWLQLTKTDTGYVHKSHYDNGSFILRIINKETIQLIADNQVAEFKIYEIINSKEHLYEITGEMSGQKKLVAIMTFDWVDIKNELAKWTFSIKGDTIMKDYFSPIENSEKYPTIIYGND